MLGAPDMAESAARFGLAIGPKFPYDRSPC